MPVKSTLAPRAAAEKRDLARICAILHGSRSGQQINLGVAGFGLLVGGCNMNRVAVFRKILPAVILLSQGLVARATDVEGDETAALDQPRINVSLSIVSLSASTLLTAPDLDGSFNVTAFLDTGASGILLSNNTADFLGVQHSTFNGQEVVYSDVGVAGSDNFNVS